MPEFTAKLTDGTTVTLSELLKTKEVVVLNIFVAEQWGELVQNASLQISTDSTSETVNIGEDGFTFIAATEPAEYHVTIQACPKATLPTTMRKLSRELNPATSS